MKKFFIKFFVFIFLLAAIIGTTMFLSRKYDKDISKFLGKYITSSKKVKKSEVVAVDTYKANTQNIMLKLNLENIDVEPAVKSVLRLGAEEVLTENGYHLISEDSEKEYLEKYNKTECNDTSCIVSMAKLLSVKGVFVINAVKLGTSYVFKLTYIDLAKNAASKIKSMLFEGELNNAKKLLVFSKEMIKIIINDKTQKTVTEEIKKEEGETRHALSQQKEIKKDTPLNDQEIKKEEGEGRHALSQEKEIKKEEGIKKEEDTKKEIKNF